MNLKNKSLFRAQTYINGLWVDANHKKTFPVKDPFDGGLLADVPDMGAAETKLAIEAAAEAFKSWRAKSAGGRAKVLKKWNSLILKNADDLAFLLTTEQGKPLAEAKGEILYGASFVEWFA